MKISLVLLILITFTASDFLLDIFKSINFKLISSFNYTNPLILLFYL